MTDPDRKMQMACLPGERVRAELGFNREGGTHRTLSFCWWAYGQLRQNKSQPRHKTLPPHRRGRGKRRMPRRWPEALRAVRGWLEPYVMLRRYCRAFSDLTPPKEL